MNVLLVVSSLNGLTQRVLCALQRAGHQARVHVAEAPDDIRAAVVADPPDLILCPYLKVKVPADVWSRWRTIIIHPGPVGDRGPSSLDWAIARAEPRWGVTALQAVEDFDAGPVWASHTFAMPDPPVRKSALYNGPVADAALACVADVLVRAQDSAFVPIDLTQALRPIPSATLRPPITQADRQFGWAEPARDIVRKIMSADGSPGVRTELAGVEVYAYDAQIADLDAPTGPAETGQVLCHQRGTVHVRAGDGSIWLGHVRVVSAGDGERTIKLPAGSVLAEPADRHCMFGGWHVPRNSVIRYHRSHSVGWLTFEFYNGAMSTTQCRRLLSALRHATAQDTKVLVLQGGFEYFSNGIHLNVIEAADDPAAEAWANIKAMNALCKHVLETESQDIIAALTGGAGAGGAMLALAADVVVARDGVILNPYYDIGLTGSELHTYTLPRRVGSATAQRLLTSHAPLDPEQAISIGLIDGIGPRDPAQFSSWLADFARRYAAEQNPFTGYDGRMPLDAIEARELAEMSRDMFNDRQGFAAARRAFTHKSPRALVPA